MNPGLRKPAFKSCSFPGDTGVKNLNFKSQFCPQASEVTLANSLFRLFSVSVKPGLGVSLVFNSEEGTQNHLHSL